MRLYSPPLAPPLPRCALHTWVLFRLATILLLIAGSANIPGAAAEVNPLSVQMNAYPAEATFSYSVREVATGATVFSYNGLKAVIPASTQKLFTTSSALEKFGPDHRFTTRLLASGEISQGRLKGHLIVKGGGDPAFASAHFGPAFGAAAIFSVWADSLKKAGISEVAGCVIADAAYLEQRGPSPSALWEDIGNYYGGIVSGLSFNDNLYLLDFTGSDKPGASTQIVGTRPRHTGITHFENRVRTGPPRSGDRAYLFGSFLRPTRLVQGTYPAGHKRFSIKGSLPHPDWTAARELQQFLAARGIRFSPDKSQSSFCPETPQAFPRPLPPGENRVLAEHYSPPMREIIKYVNQKSDNNYAEQLLALMGKHAGKRGDLSEGLQALTASLKSTGMPLQRTRLKDGSGLSRHNWVAADDFTLFLTRISTRPHFQHFHASLLNGGEKQGRLESFYGKGWSDKLYAKTGTLEGVYALAGYLKADSGRLVAFALFVNQFDASRAELNRTTAELLRLTRSAF